MRLKKIFIALIFYTILAVSAADNRYMSSQNKPAIIYQIKRTPDYTLRRKPLRIPRFEERNQI